MWKSSGVQEIVVRMSICVYLHCLLNSAFEAFKPQIYPTDTNKEKHTHGFSLARFRPNGLIKTLFEMDGFAHRQYSW